MSTNYMGQDDRNGARLSTGGWIALVLLLVFLVASIWYAVYAWGSLGDTGMSTFGWIALIAGSLITVAVGGGLMALLFYSSRNKFDR